MLTRDLLAVANLVLKTECLSVWCLTTLSAQIGYIIYDYMP